MEVFCATRGEREEADSQPIRQNLSRKVEIPNVEVHECQDYFNGHKTHVQFARLILYSKPNWNSRYITQTMRTQIGTELALFGDNETDEWTLLNVTKCQMRYFS
jgi:hypothetical protein